MSDCLGFGNLLLEILRRFSSGHEEIKRGLLLMLLGGVHKVTEEGIKFVLLRLSLCYDRPSAFVETSTSALSAIRVHLKVNFSSKIVIDGRI